MISTTKKAVFVNENENNRLLELAKDNIALLKQYQEKASSTLSKQVNTTEIIEHLSDYKKIDAEVNKLYSKKINDALKLSDMLNVEDLQGILEKNKKDDLAVLKTLATSINAKLKKVNIPLEKYILNEGFVMNKKVKRQIETITTKYAENNKQLQTIEFAEKLSEIIKEGLSKGIITTNRLQPHVAVIMDNINTGEINYAYISKL